MNWFKNLKVKLKMIISFALIIVLLAAMVVFVVIELNTVSGHYEYAIDHPNEAEVQLSYFIGAMREMRRMVSDMTIYATVDLNRVQSVYQEGNDTTYVEGVDALDAFKSVFSSDQRLSQAEKDSELDQESKIRNAFISYKEDVFDAVYAKARAGDGEGALKVKEAGLDTAVFLNDACDSLAAVMQLSAENTVNDARSASNQAATIIIIVAVVIAVISVLIALFISGLISKPLLLLADFMRRVGSTGDISQSPEVAKAIREYAKVKDEIGNAISGSAAFISHVTNIAGELETVSGGDLSADIQVLSDKDTMGMSLRDMVDNLNNMFAEIHASTSQVSTGSRQVADGAQSLAQGSTEQAASVEELSSSIAEISVRTKENAATAERTAKLSDTIRESAEKGSRQMDEMILAVQDINDASQSINKIIKTIDDIAFQTNILALNAAVEAARAGNAGKGFAVVAEEVRNLASKSAEAAKDTGSMIQNSMDKAELGSRIAGETAASLNEIVTGIAQSSQMISEIANASEQQSLGISQINIGIDQVAQVIQHNSATAQESAAASEEMSGQSDVLQQLIAQFKLKEGNSTYRSLPSAY